MAGAYKKASYKGGGKKKKKMKKGSNKMSPTGKGASGMGSGYMKGTGHKVMFTARKKY